MLNLEILISQHHSAAWRPAPLSLHLSSGSPLFSHNLIMDTFPLGPEIELLADDHLQNDLEDSDRNALRIAASKYQTHTTAGSILGLGLGVFLAFRSRRLRMQKFTAFFELMNSPCTSYSLTAG